jgi:hypothetical protein
MKVFKKAWEGWKAFGRLMGNLVARVVLSIFYFTVFVPFGIGVRLASDPLELRVKPSGLWRPRSTHDQTVVETQRQY